MDQAKARAVADPADGRILASVEIAAPPERTFRALVSEEIVIGMDRRHPPGWETSFERLAQLMTIEPGPGTG